MFSLDCFVPKWDIRLGHAGIQATDLSLALLMDPKETSANGTPLYKW